jgi:hypothetical protein
LRMWMIEAAKDLASSKGERPLAGEYWSLIDISPSRIAAGLSIAGQSEH